MVRLVLERNFFMTSGLHGTGYDRSAASTLTSEWPVCPQRRFRSRRKFGATRAADFEPAAEPGQNLPYYAELLSAEGP